MVGKNLDEGEVVKSNGYPERCLLSPTRLSQLNKVDEATQGDRRVIGCRVLSRLQSQEILGKNKRRSDHQ